MKAFGGIELFRLLTLLPLLIILLAMANGVRPRSMADTEYVTIESAARSDSSRPN